MVKKLEDVGWEDDGMVHGRVLNHLEIIVTEGIPATTRAPERRNGSVAVHASRTAPMNDSTSNASWGVTQRGRDGNN